MRSFNPNAGCNIKLTIQLNYHTNYIMKIENLINDDQNLSQTIV